MENEERNIQISISEILRMCGIPKRFYSARIETLTGFESEKKKVKEAIDRNQSIVLFGKCGVGKTHLAVGAAYYWMAKYGKDFPLKKYPKFLSTVDFMSEIRDSFDTGVSEKEIIMQYKVPQLLMLDDLGKEKRSEWNNEMLFRLVETRYGDDKPMIITSNHNLDDIAATIGDSVSSRIVQMGDVIEMKASDYRLKKVGQNIHV